MMTQFFQLLYSLTSSTWFAPVDLAVKSVLILAIAGTATVAMRRASAATRHLVWVLAVVATLTLPLLSGLMPQWRVLPAWIGQYDSPAATILGFESEPDLPLAVMNSKDARLLRDAVVPAVGEVPVVREIAQSRDAAAFSPPVPVDSLQKMPNPVIASRHESVWPKLRRWAMFIWAFGTIVLALPILISLVGLWQMGRRLPRITDDGWLSLTGELSTALRLSRPVTLLRGRPQAMPMTWGVLRPKLVLPPEADQWCMQRRRVVLMHELAHIKRKDFVVQFVVHLARAIYWFNPLMWLASRQIALESEGACDDLVLGSETRPSDYAEHLLAIAAGLKEGFFLNTAAVAMARSSRLKARLVGILDGQRNRSGLTLARVAMLGCLLMAAVLPVAAMRSTNASPWAEQRGWASQDVQSTTLESALGGWRNLPFSISKEEEADARACIELAKKSRDTINGKNQFSQPETRAALEKILSTRHGYFYAEFLLGLWHQANGDDKEADRWMELAYKDAPVVVVQKFAFADQSPLANVAVQSFALECNRVQNGSLDPSLELYYPNLQTDASGCIYLPAYATVFRTNAMANPAGFDVTWPRLGWFQTSAKVAVLPTATVKGQTPPTAIAIPLPTAQVTVGGITLDMATVEVNNALPEAALKNGAIIRLLGVGGREKRWNPLGDPFTTQLPPDDLRLDPSAKNLRALVEIVHPNAAPPTAMVGPAGEVWAIPHYTTCDFASDGTNLIFGTGAGPWTTVGRTEGVGEIKSGEVTCRIEKIDRTHNWFTRINYWQTVVPELDVALVAVLKSGDEKAVAYTWSQTSPVPRGTRWNLPAAMDVAADQIDHFDLRTRRREWVRFTGVASTPRPGGNAGAEAARPPRVITAHNGQDLIEKPTLWKAAAIGNPAAEAQGDARQMKDRECFLEVERIARLPAAEQAAQVRHLYRELAPQYTSMWIEGTLSSFPTKILDTDPKNGFEGNTEKWTRQLADAAAKLTPEQVADKLDGNLWIKVAIRARSMQVFRANADATAALIQEDLTQGSKNSIHRAGDVIIGLKLTQFTNQLLKISLAGGEAAEPATFTLMFTQDRAVIKPLLAEVEKNPKQLIRLSPILTTTLQGQPAEPALVKLLDSADLDVRIAAAAALSECVDPALAKPIANLAHETNPKLHKAALELAVKLSDDAFKTVRGDLLPLLQSSDHAVEFSAIRCFAERKDMAAAPGILKALNADSVVGQDAVTIMQALSALTGSTFNYVMHDWGPKHNQAALRKIEAKLRDRRADAAPRNTMLFNEKYAAVAVQTEQDVKFVLVHVGSLSRGMQSWSHMEDGKPAWGFTGDVALVDAEQTRAAGQNVDKRKITVKYTSSKPDTLFLDGKAYDLNTSGRVFILRDQGEPVQVESTLKLRNMDDLTKLGALAESELGKIVAVIGEKQGADAGSTVIAPKEGELSGTVTDEAGKPLAGVLLHVWNWCDGIQTRTDEHGRYTLKQLGSQPVEIRVSKDGFDPWYSATQPVGGELNLKLSNRTYFDGLVVGPDGKPVPNAQVRAFSATKKTASGLDVNLWIDARSDEKGRYRLYAMADTYTVLVRVPNVGSVNLPGQAIADGKIQPLEIHLKPGIAFRAQIIDSETGLPVANVKLSNWRRPGIEGTSDKDGNLVIPTMDPGKFEFNISAAGYARWWSAQATEDGQRKETREGYHRNFDYLDFDITPNMKPVRIELEREVRITGVIQDPDGNPVAGATAAPALTGTGNSLTGDTRYSVVTQKDGTFVMTLPASGTVKYNLEAHDGAYGQWRQWANGVNDPIQTKPGDVINNVVIKLTRPVSVSGTVKDETGKPIAGREVRASAADRMENRYYDPTTKTDENGNFTLKFVRPGEQFIQAAPF